MRLRRKKRGRERLLLTFQVDDLENDSVDAAPPSLIKISPQPNIMKTSRKPTRRKPTNVVVKLWQMLSPRDQKATRSRKGWRYIVPC